MAVQAVDALGRTPLGIGRQQLEHAVYTEADLNKFVAKLGIYALSALIEMTLDRHYPKEVFGDGSILYPTWASNDPRGGEEIDPGVRWVACLRQALEQLPSKTGRG